MVFITIIGAIALFVIFYKKIMNIIFFKDSKRNEEESVKGQIVLITGANTGIGKTTAQEMADRGANVIMACRNMNAANEAIHSIRKITNNGTLTPIKLDLGSLESIKEFSKEIHNRFDRIDILINNAGVFYPLRSEERVKTSDGFEIHFGINHLGHFLLTNLLLDLVKKGENGRIVNVSSMASMSGEMDFNDLQSEKRTFEIKSKFEVSPLYANSKLANALFSYEISKRLSGTHVKSYALCPGFVATDIFRHSNSANKEKAKFFEKFLMFLIGIFLSKNSLKGCQTILYCALNKKLSQETGKLYRNCGDWETFCYPESLFSSKLKIGNKVNSEDAKKLWEASEKFVGL